MRPSKNPLGFRFLRTWQQANEILDLLHQYVATMPKRDPDTSQYLTDLIDQILRSARSVVRNIEEGYARTSTYEYINFLGFSLGSLEELIGDIEHCLKKAYGNQEILNKIHWLSKGEAKMLNNQINSLEQKRIADGNVSESERSKEILSRQKEEAKKQEKFINEIKEKYLKGKYGY